MKLKHGHPSNRISTCRSLHSFRTFGETNDLARYGLFSAALGPRSSRVRDL
ncbi:hypothetical protein HanXRQr2_Chr05g0214951 [Helianthus annuus]|uniref:Uncharacterized protein n=1 Tax=Helianthus annuus TaxID=4232 RepID=A0A251UPT8_HELAN|nr:hypothetical protein HanXRQr2_Chr05g0214951 [Helianthus annuus]KAJ0916770.1 hypothetical protein HanPSC8_Chr06g0265671 [Helianthus annuus]